VIISEWKRNPHQFLHLSGQNCLIYLNLDVGDVERYACHRTTHFTSISVKQISLKCLGHNDPTLMKIIVTLCRLSHDFFKYSSLRKMDGTKLVIMTHKVVESGTPQGHHKKAGVSRNLENHILNDKYSTQGRQTGQCKEIRLRRSLCHRNSFRRGNNIMYIIPIWAVCLVTLWVISDLIPVSKDTIAKQSGRGGIK
jgi:hypothetical protein